MAKRRKGVGMFALTKKSAQRRNWTKVRSGSVPMVRVPRACAIVQSGDKKGRVRRGCKLTKNGAYCEELAKIPVEAKIGPKRRGRSSSGKKVWKRRTVKCT